jgi:hypothetical protein
VALGHRLGREQVAVRHWDSSRMRFETRREAGFREG